MMNFSDGLNEEQKEAINTTEGPLLVLAGAGSGKTRVVTTRIVHLLQKGISATQILGLTFTNKAANEMKERVRHLTQSNVLICTFHSLGARLLRESISHLGYSSDFTIYDESDADQLLKACINEIDPGAIKQIKELRQLISNTKNSLQEPSFNVNSLLPQVFRLYQTKLREYNAVDYDDLLALPVRLFREHPAILSFYQQRWSHLLIDEYQDTNALQYALVNHLVEKSQNICVVGDPDQSIYSWRGANIGNILNFEKDYPGAKVVRLNQNYRSRSNILEAANALITRNANRYDKELWSDRGPGEKIQIFCADSDREEAKFVAKRIANHYQQGVPLQQMVVFYRTNAQSRALEDCFLQLRIPYVVVGGLSFYQRREIKDILAWMRMLVSGNDFVSFTRTINLPKRGLGEATLEKIHQGASQEKMAIFEYCENLIQEYPMEHAIKLTAKQRTGLQAYVSIIHELRQLLPDGNLANLVTATIDRTQYLDYLAEDKETLIDRKENLNALITKAAEWELSAEKPTLVAFLEELSLMTNLDETIHEKDRVNLMTIHNGKGLEFTATFIVGMEEDLFPHIHLSRGDENDVEEERRLCYVGMTRAKEFLYMTHAVTRTIWGTTRSQRPSRFLREIPQEYIQKHYNNRWN